MGTQSRVPDSLSKLLESFFNCRPLLSRVIGRIVRPNEIEDIVQETFVLSYAAARNQKIANPRAFMLRTARNIALNHVGAAGHRLHCSLEDLSDDELLSHVSSVETQVQSDERFLAFCRAVAELPVGCRRVFILKKIYGLSQQEITDYLGLSPSTVEKHVSRGMLMTVRYMQSKGFDTGRVRAPASFDHDQAEHS